MPNLESNDQRALEPIQHALTLVFVREIAMAFAIDPADAIWLEWQIAKIVTSVATTHPTSLPVEVINELSTGVVSRWYSDYLAHTPNTDVDLTPATLRADVSVWASTFAHLLSACFQPMRALTESSIAGQFAGVLRELGVGTDACSARYLPLAVRWELTKGRAIGMSPF